MTYITKVFLNYLFVQSKFHFNLKLTLFYHLKLILVKTNLGSGFPLVVEKLLPGFENFFCLFLV